MTQLPKHLDAVYWAARADEDTAQLAQLTGRPAAEIDASMHELDQHAQKTATFTDTPFGKILVHVVDRGYPREALIPPHLLAHGIAKATELGYTVIDHTKR